MEHRNYVVGAATSVVVIFALIYQVLRSFNRWWYEPRLLPSQRPLPPGDLGWPIFGNMPQFLFDFKSGKPQAFIGRFVDKYKRIGVYRAFLFGQASILATTPEACKFVLANDDDFPPGWPKCTTSLLGRKSFVSITKEEHHRLRKLTASALNGEALKRFVPRIEIFVKEMLEYCADQDQVAFLYELKRVTFNVIADILLSYKPGPKSQALEREYRQINHAMRSMAINIPGTAYHKALKSRVRLVSLLQETVNERKLCQGPKKEDVLERLMAALDGDGNHMTDEEIIDVISMYLNSGHESSAHTTMWMAIFLRKYPEALQKMKSEQEGIRRGKKPNEGLTYDDIRSMKYTSKAMDETLRIANISPFTFRKALRDCEFNGYTIPKGWHIETWARHVHLDPEVYQDPFKFDPDRWDNLIPRAGEFLAFGLGSRFCPGNELAKVELATIMHHLLLDYTIEPVNPDCKVIYLPHPRPKDNYLARVRRLSKI